MCHRGMLIAAMFGIALVVSPVAHGQIGDQQSISLPVSIDSGLLDNPSPLTEVVYDKVVHLGDTAWFRMTFDEVNLAPGSYLRVTSLEDGAAQDLDTTTLDQWKMTSAYFNGGDVQLQLFAAPFSEGNSIRSVAVEIGALPGPIALTTCDGDDDRVVDDRNGIARMVTLSLNGPCSATIVSAEGCFFSAGHCVNFLGVAQFNVPLSSPSGSMRHPGPEDQYIVQNSSVVSVSGGVSNDYAYFSCFPNSQTGLTPVEAEGVFYPVASALPPVGTILRITGFGLVSPADETDNAQQTDTGPLVDIDVTSIGHRVDTTGGSSGSGIIVEATNELIGIHTHGGCGVSQGSFNEGTSILHPALQPGLVCCVAPTITADPQSASACSGEMVSFSVGTNAASPGYQWLFNGAAIPGATGETYTIASAMPADAGEYACIVSDPCEAISATATLTIDPPPEVLTQPQNVLSCVGASASFLIEMVGAGPFTLQWQLNGVDIPGATEDTLDIDPVGEGDFGIYRCAIGDGCGAGFSDSAALTSSDPVWISSHPFDADVALGQSVFMAVSASGGPLSFQWRHEGVDLPGQITGFLPISNVQCADAGQYDVVVTNVCGPVTSDAATLTVQTCVGLGLGDSDGDSDIDLYDYIRYLDCVTGPGGSATLECDVFDLDGDMDVDGRDYGEFQRAFTG